jgi:hypothetical protein
VTTLQPLVADALTWLLMLPLVFVTVLDPQSQAQAA